MTNKASVAFVTALEMTNSKSVNTPHVSYKQASITLLHSAELYEDLHVASMDPSPFVYMIYSWRCDYPVGSALCILYLLPTGNFNKAIVRKVHFLPVMGKRFYNMFWCHD